MERNFQFSISDDVLALGVRGAYLRFRDLANRSGDASFDELRDQTIESLLADLNEASIAADQQLAGFRMLHDRVKRSNKKYVASPENLLRLLFERKAMPRVNLLVDIYNLVSLETRLALGAHDLERVEGNVTLRLTTGTEAFWPLGTNENKGVGPGEYAYVDDGNEVICRLEVRQVEKTKVHLSTTDCFFIIQGSPVTTYADLSNATARLVELTKRFCGGQEELLYIWTG